MKKKIYIAGPLTDGGEITPAISNNSPIIKACSVAEKIVKMGAIPYVPHLTYYWHYQFPHKWSFWVEYGIEWLRSCDALFRMEGKSKGADVEVKRAQELGIPIFYSMSELKQWL